MKKVKCAECGNPKQVINSEYKKNKNHFCDRECFNKFQREKVTVKCNNCGEEKKIRPSYYEQSKTKTFYCDKQCQAEDREDEKIEVECSDCSKKIRLQKHRVKNQEDFYCSKECFEKKVKVKCEFCGEEKKVPNSRDEYINRHFCNQKCRNKWQSKNWTGENNPAWQGGKQKYYGENWTDLREKVRERDNHECRLCGISEENYFRELDVHHIEPIKNFEQPEKANTMENLISLCLHCHMKVEKSDEGAFFQSGRWFEGPTKTTTELPDVVECPECETETAEQDQDDQLYICTECGRETVLIGGKREK